MTTRFGRNIQRRVLSCAVQAALVPGLVVAAVDAHAGANAVIHLADLDGSDGFRMPGLAKMDKNGAAVSNAGDINGDGFDDVVIGSFGAEPDGKYSGSTYVVFGTTDAFTADLDLAALDGDNGFRLDGVEYDKSGWDVSAAGDVNGDGIDDLLIGAVGGSQNGLFSGSTYVVFGRESFGAVVDLGGLDGSDGFRLDGAAAYAASGASVSGAGDFNGDGFDDIVLSAPTSSLGAYAAGSSYLVFGRGDAFPAAIALSTLDGSDGLRFDGAAQQEYSGYSVSGGGDINGDGFGDLVIGAFRADWAGEDSGSSYVVFGRDGTFPATFDLGTLDGGNGLRVDGVDVADYSGRAVSLVGDLNGDGFDDIAIGARNASPGGSPFAGSSFVVFGHDGVFPATFGLAALDGSNGVRIDGAVANDTSGFAVASAGDFNGDGVDDLIIGAPGASPGAAYSGSSYVVYGNSDSFPANINLGTLGGDNGLRIDGAAGGDESGTSVSVAGDIDGDGAGDLVIGAPQAMPNGAYSGSSYVVFGTRPDRMFCDGFDGVDCSPP